MKLRIILALIILALILGIPLAFAQAPNFPQVMPPNTVYGRSAIGPGPGQAIPFSTLTGLITNPLQLTGGPLSPVDLHTTIPVNGFFVSGSGAIFNNCPSITGCVPGDHERSALYLKATTAYDASIAEYIAQLDCIANTGRSGTPIGISGNPNYSATKVCLSIATLTGAQSAYGIWGQASNFVIGTDDTLAPSLRVGTEFDFSNAGPDCVLSGAGAKACYAVLLSGNPINPITAWLSIDVFGSPTLSSHYGILINGANIDKSDIEDSGTGAIGICVGCLTRQTHTTAGFADNSNTPLGLWLTGNYSTSAIRANLPASAGGGGIYVCVDTNGVFYKKATCP